MDLNGKNKVITLLRQRPRSRVELSRETGLGKSALTKVTKQLLDEGIIKECASSSAVRTSKGGGRPESLIQLVKEIHFSLCFYISTEGMKAFLVDLSGVVHQQSDKSWQDLSIENCCFTVEQLIALIEQQTDDLCSLQGLSARKLKVLTIATQGKIAQNSGIVHYSQLLKTRNVDLANCIKDRTGIETKLFNIAYCSTFQLTQLYPNRPNFTALLLGYGLGVGVCVNREIITGPDGTALEISHMNYDKSGRKCYCGSLGCAETYVTYNAIINDIEDLKGMPIQGDNVVAKLAEILKLLDHADESSATVIKQISHVLGYILSQLVSVFDIRTVFINGETSALFPYLKQEIRAYIAQHYGERFSMPAIEFIREEDDWIALDGLMELTNRAYQL